MDLTPPTPLQPLTVALHPFLATGAGQCKVCCATMPPWQCDTAVSDVVAGSAPDWRKGVRCKPTQCPKRAAAFVLLPPCDLHHACSADGTAAGCCYTCVLTCPVHTDKQLCAYVPVHCRQYIFQGLFRDPWHQAWWLNVGQLRKPWGVAVQLAGSTAICALTQPCQDCRSGFGWVFTSR